MNRGGFQQQQRLSNITCYTCNQNGHVAFECHMNKDKMRCMRCRKIDSHKTEDCYSAPFSNRQSNMNTQMNHGYYIQNDDTQYEPQQSFASSGSSVPSK